MCKETPLTGEVSALIDDCDFGRVSAFKWTLDTTGYVVRMVANFRDGELHRRKILLHRFILDAPQGVQVDHINHDSLDNRRCNLRLVTAAQNRANARPRKDTASGLKGVHFHKRDKRWMAQIRLNGVTVHLGSFGDAKDAGMAYDRAAYAAWPEHAYINFPNELFIHN